MMHGQIMPHEPTYIALFRGINIVGNRRLPMKDLKALMENQGCLEVETYIQSGNVVFRSGMSDRLRMARLLGSAVLKSHGFEPSVCVLTSRELARAASANPFPAAAEKPTTLHLFFLADRPKKPNLAALEALRSATERFVLDGKVFYLYTPDGFGISRLAERAEKLLGVVATARNWRTVTRLLEIAGRR
jgi:uncharacterized protein (DUF1697 family)